MSSTLHDRLSGLADEAPRALPSTDLWARGRRRQRNHRLAAAAAITVVVALAGGISTTIGSYDEQPGPADRPFDELHLPRTVEAPSPWTDGTDEAGPPGPLAVLSGATRKVAEGWWGSRDYLSYFGVSAVDGSVRFLDLPWEPRGAVGAAFEVALSPDGRKVGFMRFEGSVNDDAQRRLIGWGVYDTVTGKTRLLGEADGPELSSYLDLQFSGDSRYLLTRYSRSSTYNSRSGELVAWDVETGERVVAEGPGKYWQPSVGSAPEGVVWSRQRRTFTFDPETRTTRDFVVPQEVVQASWGPDHRSLAYIGHKDVGPNEPATWHLYAGRGPADARRIPLDLDIGRIVGWRDATHVVVSNSQVEVQIVDVVTGEAESVELSWRGQLFPGPLYADDLWANDLVEGADPDHVGDPRRPAQAAVAAGALLLVGGGVFLWRRRVRA